MDIVEEIKSRISMRDVLDEYGHRPIRGTNIYRCAYHYPDKKPSASIDKRTDRFRCFSCGVVKDIFDFVQDQEKCDFKTATKILDEKFGLGLLGQLTHKQKLELAKRQKEREKAKKEKQWWAEFERHTCIKIADRLKLWEQIATDCHLTRGEYRSGNWEFADLYFHALKQHELLSWLYDTLNGHENFNSNYTYFFGTDRIALLKRIAKGEIEI